MALTDLEFRACEVLLAAARAGVTLDAMKAQMRRESIPEYLWRPLYDELGLDVLVSGEGDDEELHVHASGNITPFVRKTRHVRQPHKRSSGGAA